jgi:two-component system, chemotaxis family, CheB/CheR fusion protein
MSQGSEEAEFESLLEYLRDTRGFDFTGYKRPSLRRRLDKRMQAVGIEKHADYLDYLQVHPDEFIDLFNHILINVTGFFRDPQIWDYLSETVISRIIDAREGPIRVWCAGVASGEEAYSVAMLLAEQLGGEQVRQDIKIYGTDVDEEALGQARSATYSARQIESVPPDLLDRYFSRVRDRYVFNKDLRRWVIFGRHDLARDAPISKVDLLVCRNTLMYFNAETQGRILEHFSHALNPGGFMLLGKAEMLFTHLKSFTPVDVKRRIFMKGPQDPALLEPLPPARTEDPLSPSRGHRDREVAFEVGPMAQIMVDGEGFLRMINEKARSLLGLRESDIDRPFSELEISYKPVELRSHLDKAAGSRRPEVLDEVQWSRGPGMTTTLEIGIVPLLRGQSYLGSIVTFQDITEYKALQEDLERSNQELETAMEELQSTNEELETTNEELQSTNEELETTNEELQSTNEELETMNEELQSANEELRSVNDEARGRGEELSGLNRFLESVLSSVQDAIVVLDRDLRVQVWNGRAEDLWGLRPEEAQGESFLSLDIGLPVADLASGLRASLEGREGGVYRTELDAISRKGRTIRCRVTSTPRRGTEGEIRGVTVLMEELDGQGR